MTSWHLYDKHESDGPAVNQMVTPQGMGHYHTGYPMITVQRVVHRHPLLSSDILITEDIQKLSSSKILNTEDIID